MAAKRIVDCHVNIWNPEHFAPLYFEVTKRVRSTGIVQPKADADTIYEAMKGVDKAILFSPKTTDSAGVGGDDETTLAAVRKYPDKFVGFAAIDPRQADCLDVMRRSIEEYGLKGVKFGPIYSGVSLDDPRLEPICAYCEKNDIPMTLHMGTTFARNAPIELGRAVHVEPVAMRHPELKIILAHMGHPWYEECIAVIRKQPNMYAEISALHYRPWQFYNILIACQEYKVTDKIFFGTDFPFTTVEESIDGLRSINDMLEGTKLPRVSAQTIDSILYSDPFAHWWHEWRA